MPRIKLIQKGVRERLLCLSCETLISKYETRFKSYWYDSAAIPLKVELPCDGVVVEGADYATMKLFHLSVLWRASESEWSKSASLGPYYSQKIGKMLLDGDPGPTRAFPIVGTLLVDRKGRVFHGVITEPVRSRIDSATVYFMCYAGCEWSIAVTDHPTKRHSEVAKAMDTTGKVIMLCSQWDVCNSAQIMARYRK
jgi:hypothetical protein